MSSFPWAPSALVEAGSERDTQPNVRVVASWVLHEEEPIGCYMKPPSAPPTGHRVLGWGPNLGVGRKKILCMGVTVLALSQTAAWHPPGP